uniref:Uncharacterized protein n=1 Tax=Caenorhabditis japonica TaxID=281687 RepID=A0A8R1IKC9_CAEJA
MVYRLHTDRTDRSKAPMSPPTRKKKPMPPAPDENEKVSILPGLRTDPAPGDGLERAAEGPNKPQSGGPAPPPAVSAAESAISSTSHSLSHDKMEIVSRAGWISDDDIEVDVSVQEEEECMSLESEDEGPDPAHDAEPDFPLPVINNEVQVPARQPEHPFHDQYAPREGEEPPKDVAKRLVASVLLSQVQAFRMKTLSWFDPIEKPAPPVLTPEDEAVEQVVSLPATPFALYVVHVHRGSSAALGSVHRELAADDRPDLIYQKAECPKHLSWKKYKQQRGEESDNYLMDNENAHSTVIQL